MRKICTLVFFFFSVFSLFGQNFREARIYVLPVTGGGSNKDDNAFFYQQLNHKIVIHRYRLARIRRDSHFILKGRIEPFRGEAPAAAAKAPAPAEVKPEPEPLPPNPVPPKPSPRIRSSSVRQEFFSYEADNTLQFYNPADFVYTPAAAEEIPEESEPEPEPEKEDPSAAGKREFVLIMDMEYSNTGEIIDTRYLVYRETDTSTADILNILVYSMLNSLQGVMENRDWRNSWIFMDIGGFMAPSTYLVKDTAVHRYNIGLKFSMDFHFANNLSLGMGAQLTLDNDEIEDNSFDFIFDMPFTLKFVLKPGEIVMMEPYLGFSVNQSMSESLKIQPFSAFAGFQFGLRLGSGMAFADARFIMDPGSSPDTESLVINRYVMQFTAGYRFAFFRKNNSYMVYKP